MITCRSGNTDCAGEFTLITDTTYIDGAWTAGYVGLFRVSGYAVTHEFDDVTVWIDNDDDGILDAADDVQISDDFDSGSISMTYDNNGNLTVDGVYTYVYDAWNRLVEVQRVASGDTTTIAEYEYDARNRRLSKAVTNCGVEESAGDGGDVTVHYYYDSQWRIVETRNGSNQSTRQWVWGTRYTDELLFMDVNGSASESNNCDPDNQGGESAYDRRYFYHQDRNWNVVAISEYADGEGTDARVVERYAYTPYGEFVVLTGDSGDGEMGAVRLTSTIGNPFAHQGLPFDQELGGYQNRWRWYDVRKQRFGQRDSLALRPSPGSGYQDGAGLYVYVRSAPASNVDPLGECTPPAPTAPCYVGHANCGKTKQTTCTRDICCEYTNGGGCSKGECVRWGTQTLTMEWECDCTQSAWDENWFWTEKESDC